MTALKADRIRSERRRYKTSKVTKNELKSPPAKPDKLTVPVLDIQ